MATTMVPGSGRIRHITLRNLAMGIIFLSSARHSGDTLARANAIPVAAMAATVPAAAASIATMAARVITTNPIGIVPFESITRAATIDQQSSFRPAANFQPVFREATPRAINRARQTVLSDTFRSFNRFLFLGTEIDVTPTASPTPVPTVASDSGSEYETALQRPHMPLELLAGIQENLGELYIPDTFSISDSSNTGSSIADLSLTGSTIAASFITAPSVVGSSAAASSTDASSEVSSSAAAFVAAPISVAFSSVHTTSSASTFSGSQSRTEAASELPPSEDSDNVTLVPPTQPSMDVNSRTASRATSAAGSVALRLSYHTRRNILAGMPFFDNIPAGGLREVMFSNLPETSAVGAYPSSIAVSLSRGSRELSPPPPSEAEETLDEVTDMTALPAALLNFSPVPLGVRLKHGTWHHNCQWPEPARRQSMKRTFFQAAFDKVDSGVEMLRKRARFGDSSAGPSAGAC